VTAGAVKSDGAVKVWTAVVAATVTVKLFAIVIEFPLP